MKEVEDKPTFGLGGPQNVYVEGSFSEMNILIESKIWKSELPSEKPIEVDKSYIRENNRSVFNEFIDYQRVLVKEKNIFLVPGFWVLVEDNWKNTF